jgi:hypothetical protein
MTFDSGRSVDYGLRLADCSNLSPSAKTLRSILPPSIWDQVCARNEME